MSRVRTGWGSGDWVDEGPAKPYVIQGYGGSMVVSAEADKPTPAELALRSATKQRRIDDAPRRPLLPRKEVCLETCVRVANHRGECREQRPLCGKYMVKVDKRCARTLGHLGGCASREAMAHKAIYRRAA